MMPILRFSVLAILLLSACATDLTPSQQVYQLQRQLDVALEEVEAYASQRPCDPAAGVVVACHDVGAVLVAIDAAEEADAALDQAEEVARTGGTHQDIALYVAVARAALTKIATELTPETTI